MDGSQLGKKYPVVLRFEGLYPAQLAGYEAHRCRKGGDLGHIDGERSHLNRRLIGREDWAQVALEEIAAIKATNFADELEALEKRKRRKEIKQRIAEGPHDPWRPTMHGPLREVILTANKEWFDADLSEFFGEGPNQRILAFERHAVEWLQNEFGDDVIHARADLDEEAYHIHAVIMPRTKVEITRKGKVLASRLMLQPSKFIIIEDYEKAQDSVGAWFSQIGLVRGEKRKEAARKAYAAGQEPPPKRFHVKTQKWRIEQDKKLKAREEKVATRETEADAVIAVAEAVVAGVVDLDASSEDGICAAEGRSDSDAWTQAEAAFHRAPSRAGKVIGALQRAWRSVWPQAQQAAVDRIQAEFTAAFDGASKADAVLKQAEAAVPSGFRDRIAMTRAAFSGMIERIKLDVARGVTASDRRRQREKRKKESSEDNEL